MAQKTKATEAEIRQKLIELNPGLFGPAAHPLIPQKTKFILTGKVKVSSDNVEKDQFTLRTKLSDEAKKANPTLRDTNYLRIVKTDYVKTVTSPDEPIVVPRKAWADNLFENQQPEFFSDIIERLKEKEKWFEGMKKDDEGNPRLKMRNPVMGVFVAVQVPGHHVIGPDGKVLSNARKDISTGKFGEKSKTVMREMRMFIYDHQIPSLMSLAIAQYQKRVEPLLAEEVTYVVNTAGASERKVENLEDVSMPPETDKDDDTGKDAAGMDLP